MRFKEIKIALILEEDMCRLLVCMSLQPQHDRTDQTFMLQIGSQPCHITDDRSISKSSRQSTINVRLRRIGQDGLGLDFTDDPNQFEQCSHIREGIRTETAQRYRQDATAKMLKSLIPFVIRQSKNKRISILQKSLNQFQAEIVNRRKIVSDN